MNGGDGEGRARKDAILRLLAHPIRRRALDCLRKHGSMTLADLAEEIARLELNRTVPRISEDEILEIYLALWHQHIPKLSEHDVVEYDQTDDLVRLVQGGDLVSALAEELASVNEFDYPRSD